MKTNRPKQPRQFVKAQQIVRSLQKHMPCQHKDGIFHLYVRRWHFNNGCGAGCTQRQTRLKFLSAWKGASKEFDNVRNALRTRRQIASGMAKSYQESYVTCDAVADRAKARQVDKKTFLKNGGQRIVEVGSFCESPQFLSDLGSFGGEAEEIGKNPKSSLNALPQVWRRFGRGGCT